MIQEISKIGILTYHRVGNDGSVLQAISLYRAVVELYPNANVEVIDYYPSSLVVLNLKSIFLRRRIAKVCNARRRYRERLEFLREQVNLSMRYVSDNLCKAQRWIDSQEYDLIIVGSDTVWTLHQQRGFPKRPNLYWAPTTKSDTIVAAYAASIDPLRENLRNGVPEKEELRKHWLRFDAISYRDSISGEVLRECIGSDMEVRECPDPTFLVDLDRFVVETDLRSKRPVLALSVSFCAKALCWALAEEARAAGFAVVDLTGRIKSDDLLWADAETLGERLGYIRNCDALITDRFHTSIFFSYNSRKPMAFIEHSVKWPFENSKGRDLYKKLGIPGAVVRATQMSLIDSSARKLVRNLHNGDSCIPDSGPLRLEGKRARMWLGRLGEVR